MSAYLKPNQFKYNVIYLCWNNNQYEILALSLGDFRKLLSCVMSSILSVIAHANLETYRLSGWSGLSEELV